VQRTWFGFVGLLVMPLVFSAIGCGGDEQQGEQQRPRTVTEEVTRVVTVQETVPAAPESPVEKADKPEAQSPEETLALQYRHINAGDYEDAYALFAEQSKEAVPPEQYRAFFEENAPYSLTDYSFPSVEGDGESATVEVEFTVSSASGQESYERTQQLVREAGQWRVVMRADQAAAFAGMDPEDAASSAAGQSDAALQIGETADVDGVQVTVNEVYRTYGDEFDRQRLQPGEVFVVMDTTLLNEGETTPYVSTVNWTLYDQDGYRLEPQYLSALDDTPEYYGDLRPGRQFSGPVAVVASESDTIIAEYLPLEAMPGSNNYATWDIGPVSELPDQGSAASQY
jgi:predicted nucleic acid-binding protein